MSLSFNSVAEGRDGRMAFAWTLAWEGAEEGGVVGCGSGYARI